MNIPIQAIINSVAYCGLVCRLCHLADKCDGCKSATNKCGKHLSEEGCLQRNCCIEKNLDGCWQCDDFPCNKDMYSEKYDRKIVAYARCIKEEGVEQFIKYIIKNEKVGIKYGLNKDYDFKNEDQVLDLLRFGKTEL